jgi:asparagine synthase (glutamine-hydrolysing)
MCGIAGICSQNDEPVKRTDLEAQIQALIHRGPDQCGIYLSPTCRCGLGSRRLSIIDLAGGRQPLSNEDNTIHLVYNGETYNYQVLRAELEQIGHRPRTHSDAEAVLHGYEAWGIAGMLQKLRGMYAFALWDETRGQLVLARDRFGIKPLYYTNLAGRFMFASEIKAILTQPDVPRRVNLTALETMLTLGFVPGSDTLFAGIHKLPPAHFLTARDGLIALEKYWELDYREEWPLSGPEAADRLLELLQESVRLRLMSEVPLGALLSGGLDSGTVVALAKAGMDRLDFPMSSLRPPHAESQVLPNHRLKTVSIGFEHPAYDEASLARELAQLIGTDHHSFTFTPGDFDDYPEIMFYLEEPQCSATAVPLYRLYQACRQLGLTVILTGEGADELLGGYHWHRGDALMRPLLLLPEPLRRLMAQSPLPMSSAARRVLCRGHREIAARYGDWLEVGGEDYRQQLFLGTAVAELRQNSRPLLAGWAEKLAALQTDDPFQQALWLETQTRLVDFINMEVDKMSMAHGIEARVPFLDHKLWEFCAGLPSRHKLNGRTEKYLLRQATRDILPRATRTRSKKGLAAPYAYWLRSERLPDWAESALSTGSIKRAGLFNPAAVRQLRLDHQAGRPNLGSLLMGVLSTQIWFNTFIG